MNVLTLIKVTPTDEDNKDFLTTNLPSGSFITFFDDLIVNEQTYSDFYSWLSPLKRTTFFRGAV